MEKDLSPIQRSLLVIEKLKSKLKAFEDSTNEPIAIVGMSCRFPGGAINPEEYWHLLSRGVDAIEEIPGHRWDVEAHFDSNPDTPGKSYSKQGGFLQSIEHFDPHFFGISPREAISIDPQHRLLLEVSWEALENAGLAITDLRGSHTGVFMGITLNDYEKVIQGYQVDNKIEPYSVTGLPLNAAAGRISYTYGFTGPALAIDTACSSSLVAIHQACQSLRLKECNMALAGGVNLILTPASMIGTSKARMLSADGRCKTFDEGADGIGRAEGCGIIVLKRLSEARKAKDNILGIIRGSAVNQDGASSGFTVPNSHSQQALIRQALKMAKIEPSDISYIEAHGTGTPLGDPIELRSLAGVFGKDSIRKSTLKIGSVKTNIGHAESASGIAGVMKVILQLQHKKIAPNLHFKSPTSKFNWDEFRGEVPTKLTDWDTDGGPRIAGVSSFGASGTNAHVVLEEASTEQTENVKTEKPDFHFLALSAKSSEALNELTGLYHKYLERNPDIKIEDICNSAITGRTHLNNRIAIVASDKSDLIQKFAGYQSGEQLQGLIINQSDSKITNPEKVVFLFTGQGSQYVNMGKELYESQAVFKQAIELCTEIVDPYLECSLTDILFPVTQDAESIAQLNETKYAQPAIVAIQYALVKLWESWGIKPTVVMGHSVGEYTAAVVAGVMSIEDCLKLIAMRGKLMQALPVGGGMVSVNISKAEIHQYIASFNETVSIAAINGSNSTVISGSLQSLELIVNKLKQEGHTTAYLNVSHAFHSPLMEPILKDFEAFANKLTYNKPQISIISNVTGLQERSEIFTASYWANHIIQPVNFDKGLKTISELSYQIYLEIGPKPVLSGMGRQSLPSEINHWIPSLRATVNELKQMLLSLGELYVLGVECKFAGVYGSFNTKKVILPTYPFQRQYCWVDVKNTVNNQHPSLPVEFANPYIGRRSQKAGSRDIYFRTEWSCSNPAYIEDHIIFEKIVVAGASHVSMLLSAFKEVSSDEVYHLEDIYFTEALVFNNHSKRLVEVVLDSATSNSASLTINSYKAGKNEKRKDDSRNHVSAKAYFGILKRSLIGQQILEIDTIKRRCVESISGDEFYDAMWRADYHLGTSFRWIQQIWQTKGEAICTLNIPELSEDLKDFVLHPGLIDSCLQMVGITADYDKIKRMENDDYIFAPFHIEKFQLYQQPTNESLWCYCVINDEKSNEQVLACDITLINSSGEKIAEIVGFETRKAPKDVLLKSLNTEQYKSFHEINWLPKPINSPKVSDKKTNGKWLIFGADEMFLNTVGQYLNYKDQECIFVTHKNEFLKLDEQHYHIDSTKPSQVERLVKENYDINNIVLLSGIGLDSQPLDVEEIQKAQHLYCASLYFIQATLKLAPKKLPSIFMITEGTQNVTGVHDVTLPGYAPLWGIGKVLSVEHPEITFRLIDLDKQADEAKSVSQLVDELFTTSEENQVAIRHGIRYVPRIAKCKTRDLEPKNKVTVQENASYLITGGLGDLGLELAQWLVGQGAKSLVLTGRSTVSEKAKVVIEKIEAKGVSIMVSQSDVSDEKQLETLFAEMKNSLPSLKGIIHAAGVLEDAPIEQMNRESFLKVITPKIQGSLNLHKQTAQMYLDFFVCFSSMSSFIGTHYQSNYAAANAFMDAIVVYRRAAGLPGLSINWGPWDKVGMASRMGNKYKNYLEKSGVSFIDPLEGIQGLALLLATDKINVGFIDIDWDKYENHTPLLENLITTSKPEPIDYESYLNILEGRSNDEQIEIMIGIISKEIGRILGTEITKIDIDEPLSMIGVDSLMAVEIRAVVQKRLNVDIPIGKLLEGGNISNLAGAIVNNLSVWTMDSTVGSNYNNMNNEANKNAEAFIEGEL